MGLAAPRVFDDFHELLLGLGLGCCLVLAACRDDPRGWLGRFAPPWRWAPALAVTVFMLIYEGSQAFVRPAFVVHQERSFFGVLRVEQREDNPARHRALKHGSTLHGV